MATQQRPYQGYPYRNPPVTDVPSIDKATASRWANLPRRPLHKNIVYVDIPEDGSQVSESSGTDSRPRQDKKDLDANPVIYIDVPEDSSSSVAEPVEPELEPEYVQDTIFYNPFDNRRIDQGKDEESARPSDSDASSSRPPRATRPAPPGTLNLTSPGSSGYSSNYTTPDLPPSMSKETYVYQARNNHFPASPIPISEFPQPPPAYTEIEIPAGGGPVGGPVGRVVENPRSPVPNEPPRTVVITQGQDMIFYNPFDNRRIDQGKDEESGRLSNSDASSSRPPRATRPAPPSTLDLTSPGSSGYSSNYTTPGQPPSMSKETYVYQAQNNRFPASPIPISEFPKPPPAYTEIETPVRGGPVGGVVESPRSPVPNEPPRTVVITPGSDQRMDEPSPIGLPNPYRKVVYCQHCGRRVHTLVIRQTGKATHVIALSFLCCGLFPMTILAYLTDTCKNKNHYCPNCNKMIGYEVPVICQDMTYTKPEEE